MEARIEQAFVRYTPVAALSLQAGKFASPMGGYPQRHHTLADPLIRPPLPYEHRTILSATRAPVSVTDFLAWKDLPENRGWGAPPIWGAPYPWGAMVLAQRGVVSGRAAIVNSAPSSEPAEWGWKRGWSAPSYVANLAVQPMPWLRVEASYDRGPWMSEDAVDVHDPNEYQQSLWGGEVVFARGGSKLRGEAFYDTWGVSNVGYDVTDTSWYIEGEQDVGKGVTLAGRYGTIGFSTLSGSGGTIDPTYKANYSAAWDYDVERLQLGGAYRLARNAGLKLELALNASDDPRAPRSNLFSAQLWWQF
jgi:hypothetical protein